MIKKDYEYSGLMATTWDMFRGDTSHWEDRFFYLELIEQYGQPVLDVGCATGRLTLDYLENGIDVEGMDVSPEMLAICRQKAAARGLRPVLYQQALERMELPRKYRTILVPSSSFQLVTDPALAQQAMRRLFAHLQVGGALVMPFMRLYNPGEPLELDWRLTAEAQNPLDGSVARRWSRWRYDPRTRLEHTEDRYEILQEGRVIQSEYHRRSPATRDYTQEEAVQLYRDAGFASICILSGFTYTPASPGDALFTVVGVKP